MREAKGRPHLSPKAERRSITRLLSPRERGFPALIIPQIDRENGERPIVREKLGSRSRLPRFRNIRIGHLFRRSRPEHDGPLRATARHRAITLERTARFNPDSGFAPAGTASLRRLRTLPRPAPFAASPPVLAAIRGLAHHRSARRRTRPARPARHARARRRGSASLALAGLPAGERPGCPA